MLQRSQPLRVHRWLARYRPDRNPMGLLRYHVSISARHRQRPLFYLRTLPLLPYLVSRQLG